MEKLPERSRLDRACSWWRQSDSQTTPQGRLDRRTVQNRLEICPVTYNIIKTATKRQDAQDHSRSTRYFRLHCSIVQECTACRDSVAQADNNLLHSKNWQGTNDEGTTRETEHYPLGTVGMQLHCSKGTPIQEDN